jgi:hypothetical protein
MKQGKANAVGILSNIQAKLGANLQTLAQVSFSDEYVLGVHFGDGSLYIGLSWKPSKAGQRLRCEPEWAISGDNKPYCDAFSIKFDGITKPVDKAGQQKFALTGIQKCLNIFNLFDNAPWMPLYKREQYTRWKESILLLDAQEHFSKDGIIKLVDLTYGLAEKGGRKYTKDEYLAWGMAWLNDPSRQKRKPQSKNP